MFNPSRWRNIATARTLFVMIFLAGVGLIFSIISLLYLSQNLISSKTNDIDARRSALSVDGPFRHPLTACSHSLPTTLSGTTPSVRFMRRSWTPRGCIIPGGRLQNQ